MTVVHSDAELTTQPAADTLAVSRPYPVGLLEGGEAPFRLVGTHRRVEFDDLRTYRRRLEESGRAAADELSELGQEWESEMDCVVDYDANVLYGNTCGNR